MCAAKRSDGSADYSAAREGVPEGGAGGARGRKRAARGPAAAVAAPESTRVPLPPVPVVAGPDADFEAQADGDPDPDGEGGAQAVRHARVPRDHAGLRVDQSLAKLFPEHSRNRLKSWLEAGHVLLDGASAEPSDRLLGGESVDLAEQPGEAELAFRPEDIPLSIVHEDDSVVVLDKPAGLVVHPGSGNWQGTMLNGLLFRFPALVRVARAGIVHRLDKDTSGLLVVAKTPQAQTHLVRQLQARTVKREYLAVVHGAVAKDGEVDAPIGRDTRVRTRMAVVPDGLGSGREALTRYRVLRPLQGATLLECSLATGRTHQIRVHMLSIGHPLVGDTVYTGRGGGRTAGSPDMQELACRLGRQALHAQRLAFVHPTSRRTLQFESPVPADLGALVESLS